MILTTQKNYLFNHDTTPLLPRPSIRWANNETTTIINNRIANTGDKQACEGDAKSENMKYTLTTPCKECPFLNKFKHGYSIKRLKEFSQGEFPCHKTAELNGNDEFHSNQKSIHCAGALIFLEKRSTPNQMMRISERLGMYDYRKLNMDADVR